VAVTLQCNSKQQRHAALGTTAWHARRTIVLTPSSTYSCLQPVSHTPCSSLWCLTILLPYCSCTVADVAVLQVGAQSAQQQRLTQWLKPVSCGGRVVGWLAAAPHWDCWGTAVRTQAALAVHCCCSSSSSSSSSGRLQMASACMLACWSDTRRQCCVEHITIQCMVLFIVHLTSFARITCTSTLTGATTGSSKPSNPQGQPRSSWGDSHPNCCLPAACAG
jgi:hypothetical protein